jgi:hypothetical protein
MAILCLVACWCGYFIRPSVSSWYRIFSIQLDEDRIFFAGVVLVAFGTFSTFQASRAAEQAENLSKAGTYTGAASMWFFFAHTHSIGLGIVMMRFLRKPTLVTFVAVMFGLWNPVICAIFYGRREYTAQTIYIILFCFFFQRGLAPPRWLVVLGIMGVGILIPVTDRYRSYAKEDGLAAFARFDPIEAFMEGYWNGKAPELTVAARVVAVTNDSGEFNYGRGYWNVMVFRFIPAQIVGRDTKDALMMGSLTASDSTLSLATSDMVGCTQTGMGDAFVEFWYFGCLFFVVLGILFRILWDAANDSRSLLAQLLTMLMLTGAMRAITHQTSDFLPGLVYNSICLWFVVMYSRVPSHV